MTNSSEGRNEDFDWLSFKKEFKSLDDQQRPETFTEKFSRRFSENPFVPIGALATIICLTMGLRSFQQGNVRKSQIMMRGRIAAQGFTVVALIGGLVVAAFKAP